MSKTDALWRNLSKSRIATSIENNDWDTNRDVGGGPTLASDDRAKVQHGLRRCHGLCMVSTTSSCRSRMRPNPSSRRSLRARVYNAGARDGDPNGCRMIRTLLGLLRIQFGWNFRTTPRIRVAKETDLRVALKSDKNSCSTPSSQTYPYSRFCGSLLWTKAA